MVHPSIACQECAVEIHLGRCSKLAGKEAGDGFQVMATDESASLPEVTNGIRREKEQG
jgi:hypothetical protein